MGMYVRHLGPLIEIQTPAKLNLFLEVLARRPDGFHEIETLMTPIGIYDTLYVAPAPYGTVRFQCGWAAGIAARAGSVAGAGGPEAVPTGGDNLVVRALERLRRRAGVEAGATVRLIKRIPLAAGLGGASSDAAAALVGANRLWALGWSRERLAEVAAEIGSDVPFFLQAGAAVARGRGERLAPLAGLGTLHVVVVRPPAGLSTGLVYQHCQPATAPRRVEPVADALRRGRAAEVGRGLFNRLQTAAEQLSPWIGRLRNAFERVDCLGHQMSGSGTGYFGICRSARQARRMAGQLRAAGWEAVFPASTCAGGSG